MATYNFLDKTGLGQVWAKIKALIPTKTSDLTNDSGFIDSYTETDPVFSASPAAGITTTDISNWDAKSSTDEKLSVSALNEEGTFYPIVSTTTTQATKKNRSENFAYISASDGDVLRLGQIGGKSGKLRLFEIASSPAHYTTLQVPTLTANRTAVLPNKSGTIALTSDISYPVTSVNTKTGAVSLTASDVGALPDNTVIPTKTSDLTNDSGFITGYTETDPVFSASPAAGITATDISNWDAKVSDDKTWNGVTLNKTSSTSQSNIYIPYLATTGASSSGLVPVVVDTTGALAANRIPKYNNSGYLVSTTPSANDNSTKVATTAYVDSAIMTYSISISNNRITLTPSSGTASYIDLPVYDGSVSTGGGS